MDSEGEEHETGSQSGLLGTDQNGNPCVTIETCPNSTVTITLRCVWNGCGHMSVDYQAFLEHTAVHVDLEKAQNRFPICYWDACFRKLEPFRQLGAFLDHFRFHTKERPFVCRIGDCRRTFSRKDLRTIHEKQHTTERPFACLIKSCPIHFTNPQARRKHLEQKHGYKKFQKVYQGKYIREVNRPAKINNLAGTPRGTRSNGKRPALVDSPLPTMVPQHRSTSMSAIPRKSHSSNSNFSSIPPPPPAPPVRVNNFEDKYKSTLAFQMMKLLAKSTDYFDINAIKDCASRGQTAMMSALIETPHQSYVVPKPTKGSIIERKVNAILSSLKAANPNVKVKKQQSFELRKPIVEDNDTDGLDDMEFKLEPDAPESSHSRRAHQDIEDMKAMLYVEEMPVEGNMQIIDEDVPQLNDQLPLNGARVAIEMSGGNYPTGYDGCVSDDETIPEDMQFWPDFMVDGKMCQQPYKKSAAQHKILADAMANRGPYIENIYSELAERAGLTLVQVRWWFQNKRSVLKRNNKFPWPYARPPVNEERRMVNEQFVAMVKASGREFFGLSDY